MIWEDALGIGLGLFSVAASVAVVHLVWRAVAFISCEIGIAMTDTFSFLPQTATRRFDVPNHPVADGCIARESPHGREPDHMNHDGTTHGHANQVGAKERCEWGAPASMRELEARALRSRPWARSNAEFIELVLDARRERDGHYASRPAAMSCQMGSERQTPT